MTVATALPQNDRITEIYKKYYSEIYKYILKLTGGNSFLADDICSQTFLSLLKAWTKFQAEDNFLRLLRWIAKCRYIDYIRIEQTHSRKLFQLQSELSPDCRSLEEELIRKELKKLIQLELQKLKRKYRRVLELKYFEQKRYKEIARLEQKTPKTIEYLITKAKKALGQKLYSLVA